MTVIRLSDWRDSSDSNLEVESYLGELGSRFPMLEVVTGYDIKPDETQNVFLGSGNRSIIKR